mmetsp:Transcript_35122/g.77283  ORF Transcript_35122/g.77283 Transcript_35122/m.77283 type:complete len:243 (-) Transcript_35122:890-1618(-)
MGPRRASAQGGQRVGSGRLNTAAHSRRARAEARDSTTSHAEPQASSDPNETSTMRTRRRTAGASTSTAPSPPALSPVSRARASKAKLVEEMTRAELEAAYHRAVQQRNYPWRRERKHKRQDAGVASTSSTMRNTSLRANTATEKATSDRHFRLFKVLRDTICRRPATDHAHAIDLLVLSLSAQQRTQLRALPSMQQERYLAQRDLCRTLRAEFSTPKATLTVRLENFLPTRSIDRAMNYRAQ